jgi:hypothetical protein
MLDAHVLTLIFLGFLVSFLPLSFAIKRPPVLVKQGKRHSLAILSVF